MPYGAGGGADSRSRQIAQKMSVILKQPIIVDNKPGASDNVGTEFISRAAPDSYTIGMGMLIQVHPIKLCKISLRQQKQSPEY